MRNTIRVAVRRFGIGLPLVISLLGVSCLVGPGFHAPQTRVPDAWTGEAPVKPAGAAEGAAAGQASPVPPADLSTWWRQFADPELTSLIEEALRGNYDLQTAEARLRQSRALRGVAAGALWPQVMASAAYDRLSSGGVRTGTFATARGPNFYQAGLDAAWEIDVFGGLRRNLESAGAEVLAARENINDVQVSLVSEVAIVYTQLRGAQQRIAIARDNLEAQRRTAEITRKRQSVGFVSSLDVANAEAQVATTLSQIPSLEIEARQSVYSLSVLLARAPASLLQELSAAKPLPVLPAQVPVGAPPDLLRRRPDIRQAEALLHAATAQIGVAEAELFPKIAASGAVTWQSDLVRNWFNKINRSWSVGAAANWTLFNGGSNIANVHAQEAARDQALIAYRQIVLSALQDVENALIAYSKDQERRQALSDAVANFRRAVDLSTQLYVQGETEFINVLDAERSLYASEDALVLSDASLVTDIITLFKALGGGWEAGPSRRS